MNLALSPTQSDLLRMLRSFLLAVLPDGTEVFQAQDNRVPEPSGANFVVMTPLRRERLSTNVDGYVDCLFTGSIAAAVMTVTAVALGALKPGNLVFGQGATANTRLVAQLTGPSGGPGTYTVAPAQTLASRQLAAGVATLLQPTQITVQLDVHGPLSADNAQKISTAFRDQYGVAQFAAQIPPLPIAPLYTSDPTQMPFIDENDQYEWRWVVDAVLQADQTLTVPQDFAGTLTAGIINVEATYPP